ncbi:hypothetical protein H6G97_34055, partial [Nostoc flagelliforme FACHB-838]|nr:hypothetical protein [Nostoc flagelliforme FACHB-838]
MLAVLDFMGYLAYATRCLRVHSGVGSDVEHVEETVALVAALTPEERTRVT